MHADFVVWDTIENLLEYLDALHSRLVLFDLFNTLDNEFMLDFSVPVPSQFYKFVYCDLHDLALVRSLLHGNVPEQLSSSD